MKLTKSQQHALLKLYHRYQDGCTPFDAKPMDSFLTFRRQVHFFYSERVAMIELFGMWFGIEPDGYTHT
jgi:hypothetical protein